MFCEHIVWLFKLKFLMQTERAEASVLDCIKLACCSSVQPSMKQVNLSLCNLQTKEQEKAG